ncbi:PAS domain S-box-containing protein/diguanylate cyclase (GGDEF)-like protein [Paucimonas lemoignei]|uniref:PAS domain S-box-containing protein/diguanylate cyclase (GGDEF)-like protein n=1 Tax=Paucimonas lemoignei TaxID=29443 RepID=A0A4V2UID9_PAULE|nr:EAL domain-containing protein [Paucimonas lemoignei]TCS35760.1 PAS domain S-box-containing protein/diguanylate cyclase (GGDEF)-like protein [Paucimonas lemoignei]
MKGKSTPVATSSGEHNDPAWRIAEQAEDNNLLQAIYSSMPEGFALAQVATGDKTVENFSFIRVNAVFCQQHGIDPGVVDNPAHPFYRHPPDWLLQCALAAWSGKPFSAEYENAGSKRHFEMLSYSPQPGTFVILSRDITARKLDAIALQEREHFMRDMLSSLPGIVWAASAYGKIEFLSAQWSAYTGKNITGPGVDWSVMHPDDVDNAMRAWRDAVRNQSAWSVECRLRRHDGQYRWFAWRGTPLCNPSGKAASWFGVCTDIDDLKRTQEKLAETEQRYTTLFNNHTVAIAHYAILADEAGNPVDYLVERVNQAYENIFGVARTAVEGKRITEVFPDVRNASFDFIGIFGRVGLHGGEVTFEAPTMHPASRWVSIYAYSPKPGECTALFFDISERKRLEQARRESERRLQLAISIAHLGFWEWEVSSGTCYYSPSWKKQLGYQDTELANTPDEWEQRLHPDDRERVLNDIELYLARPSTDYRLEYRLRHRDGSYRWMIANAVPLSRRSKGGIKLIGTQLDITENKLAEQRVREAALHDPLTGLPNRALIFEYASHLIAAAKRNHQRGAVLFIDLDRFKPINDLYGHEIGDKLLQEAARRLTGCVRAEDLVGRLGGDEFVVVLPHADDTNPAVTVADHVLEALSAPFEIDALDLSISASVGISYFPEHGTDVDTLIHAADLAMYQAKHCCHGSAQIFSDLMSTRFDAASSIEARLKRALSQGGLVLHYQPVIDMKSRRLTSVEALLRLTTEDGKLLGPDQFVPIAESAGLIAPLGEWVAAEACRQHEEWRRQGLPPVTIAINVSPLQFRQRGFATRLTDIILDSTVEPGRIEVEVTESTLMDNLEDAVEILERIRSCGIRIALDDFGTGYSSLSRLSHLPLDKLKVDQSFVRRLDTDRASRAITGAIITLGRTLNLEVVGEGIESELALDYLQEHGCNQAQGFFISRPLAASIFAEWYRARFTAAPAMY